MKPTVAVDCAFTLLKAPWLKNAMLGQPRRYSRASLDETICLPAA
ncbi:MAG TPA: hypothetical protein VII58_05685 [Acidobacteriaceae bacterium]